MDGTAVKIEIWDTAGQEVVAVQGFYSASHMHQVYKSLAPMYFRGSQAAVVVYDMTDAASFNRAKAWVKDLKAC